MKKFGFVLFGTAAAFFLAAAVLTLPTYFSAAAQKNAAPRWEYCAVTGTYVPAGSENQPVLVGSASICYLQATGCQNEEVRAELPYARFLQDWRLENSDNSKNLAFGRVKENAYARAVAKLGADGWEMVGQPSVEFDNYVPNYQGTYTIYQGNKEIKPDVYFKRLKQ